MLSDELQNDGQRLTQLTDEWLWRTGNLVYDVYGGATSRDQARTNLGVGSMGFQDPRNVTITGGYGIFDRLRVQRSPVEPTDVVPLGYARSALFTSSYLFKDKGDLLVYQYPLGPAHIVPVGDNDQVFHRSLSWVDAPDPEESSLPAQIVGLDLVVAVGPVEHPTAHDLWYATVGAFNAAFENRIVVGSLTVLPNGFSLGATGVLQLPRCAQGASITIGQPNGFATDGRGVPVSALTLAARGAHIRSDRLSLFAKYDVQDSQIDADILWLQMTSAGTIQRPFTQGCKLRIGSMFYGTATADAQGGIDNVDIEDSEVTVDTLDMRLAGATGLVRFLNSDVWVQKLEQPEVGDEATRLRVVNSSFYVVEPYESTTANLALSGANSHIHLGSGVPYAV